MARCGWTECGRWRPSLLAKRRGRGVHMNGVWFCSDVCAGRQAASDVERATTRERVRTRALPRLKLGLLLVHQGAITPVQLRDALASQRHSGLRLGDELLALGLIDDAALVKALATQAGVPCLPNLDVTAVRPCPELGATAVRALGVVPIGVDVDAQHVKVACTAPVPRLALAALRELTGWTAEPYLVPDSSLERLIDAYASVSAPDRDALVARDDAGAAIAAAAAGSDDAVVSQAPCSPYLWVRVSRAAGPHDLFIPTGEDLACPVAHTSL